MDSGPKEGDLLNIKDKIIAYKKLVKNTLERCEKNTCTEKDAEPSEESSNTESMKIFKSVFITPNKTKKRKLEDRKMSSPIPLRNRFEALNNENETAEQEIPESAISEVEEMEVQENISSKKQKKLPPVIIHQQVADHRIFVNSIKSVINGHFTVKYCKETTNVYVETKTDLDILKEHLQKVDVSFHSYSLKDEKTHAFVLRGLNAGTNEEDVSRSLLEDHKIKTIKVYKMNTKNTPPMFLVVTNKDITVKQLEQKVRYVYNTRIYWQRHINKKKITQCHRCQLWSHATSNCYAKPRCVKCAQGHLSNECNLNKDQTPKCANCGKSHVASSELCEVYQKKLEYHLKAVKSTRKTSQTRYIPAPAPTINAWETRRTNANNTATPAEDNKRIPGTKLPAEDMEPPSSQARANNSGVSMNMGTFENISCEIRKLQGMIDLGKFLISLKNLNNILETCQTEKDKFYAFLNFMNNYGN